MGGNISSIYSSNLDTDEVLKDNTRMFSICKTIKVISKYATDNEYYCDEMLTHFKTLPQNYLDKLSFKIEDRVSKMKAALNLNANFLKDNVEYLQKKYKADLEEYDKELEANKPNCTIPDCRECQGENNWDNIMEFHSTLQLFQRDWSKEGIKERTSNIEVVLQELTKYFTEDKIKEGVKLLVPGCGLGRLVYELLKKGYLIDGCEYSASVVLLFDYFFKNIHQKESCEVSPYCYFFSNIYKDEVALRSYKFPDVDILEELKDCKGKFHLSFGDFNQCYLNKKGTFDCVVTLFFIDTSPNVIQYIETIYNSLKVGGIWINLGPLLYHFAGYQNYNSIELSFEEVKHVAEQFGFQIKHEEMRNCYYDYVDGYMMNKHYECPLISAVKVK